jgi:hypothetical protein
MTTLIQSHNYTINLDNVVYFKEWIFPGADGKVGTIFTMSNGKVVTITCPYDKVLKQVEGSVDYGNRVKYQVNIIRLDY